MIQSSFRALVGLEYRTRLVLFYITLSIISDINLLYNLLLTLLCEDVYGPLDETNLSDGDNATVISTRNIVPTD